MARRIKKSKKIVIYIILCCIITCIIDFIIKPSYIIKSIIKIILFFIIPFLLVKKRDRKQLRKMISPKKSGLLKPILLGISLYILVLFLYFLLSEYYDLSKIINTLYEIIGINKQNIILMVLYISIINSLLEEFFFRAFSFLFLKKHIKKIYAYLISSITFTISHVSILTNILSVNYLIIFVISFILIELIFNYLDEKNNNIYNSWMSHMFIYLAINTIGLINYGII